MEVYGMDSYRSEQGQEVGSYKQSNELSRPVKCDFLD
jgi:hypothetical protein